MMTEIGGMAPEKVRVDCRRGVFLAGRIRVGEWKGKGEDGEVELHEGKGAEAGIETDAKTLRDAVAEAMQI